MASPAKAAAPLIGVIFLALAVLKFLTGGAWVVWAILAFFFGGFGIFSGRCDEGGVK